MFQKAAERSHSPLSETTIKSTSMMGLIKTPPRPLDLTITPGLTNYHPHVHKGQDLQKIDRINRGVAAQEEPDLELQTPYLCSRCDASCHTSSWCEALEQANYVSYLSCRIMI